MPDPMLIGAVALGGALGAVARYLVSVAVASVAGLAFPWGTLLVNVLGSLLIGVVFALLLRNAQWHAGVQATTMAGFLGAFTTFSTYSLELYQMLAAGRWLQAGSYAIASVVVCVAAVALGIHLVRSF